MNNSSEDDFIRLPRDAFVLNTLAMGVAIQILAKITEEPIEAWRECIRSKADEQYHQLSEAEIQEIVDSLEKEIRTP
ncbi:MAG: hypothetical protein V7L05_08145 [Nostoc sp.]|uniref:hypothetical protein n=1 Tax=Nostoc sp. TaxID=1180 RepID=UPI002FF4E4C8